MSIEHNNLSSIQIMTGKSFNINKIAKYMSVKYKHLDEETTKAIIKAFCRYLKSELLSERRVVINRFCTFYVKEKKGKVVRTIFKKMREKPVMKVPFFKVTSVFREYLNSVL